MKEEINDKQNRLLDNAFKLFTKKGVTDTSIQEIVDNANVAKGTFYLYFKDKYEIRDILISKKSKKLFNNALKDLRKTDIKDLTIDTSVDFAAMGGTFISGVGDFVTLFEPSATKVENEGYGYVVGYVGEYGGFSCRRAYSLRSNRQRGC